MDVLSLIIYTKYFWDFDMWPFNREWPLNGGPLNRGSTVFISLISIAYNYLSATRQSLTILYSWSFYSLGFVLV